MPCRDKPAAPQKGREQDGSLRCLHCVISHCVIPRTAALLLIAVLASCSRPPLKPRILNGPLPTTELINDAELIVVGTMTSLTFGKPIHMNIPNLSDCLIPVRVSVSVENVLRGSVTAKLSFDIPQPNCGTSGPVESPRLGTRSVFFLRKDAGRCIRLADYWMNRIPVYTGRHSNEFLLGKPIEQAISELLLTAGIGCSTKQLEEALGLSMPISSALIVFRPPTSYSNPISTTLICECERKRCSRCRADLEPRL